MKFLILIISLYGLNANAIENDKKLHLTSTMFISGLGTAAVKASGKTKTQSILTGIVLANMVGYAKESTDVYVDKEDLKYNLIGSIIGSFTVWEF